MVSLAGTRIRVLVFLAVLALVTPAPVVLAQESTCPSGGTPPPGSTVNGGLDVDGVCLLDSVTVNGGILVEAGGHLQLTRSTVNGDIVALPCGELDVNAVTGNGSPTGTTSTINGGIHVAAGLTCSSGAFSDLDIWTAQIAGDLTITGTYPTGFAPFICGNTITGSVRLEDVTVTQLGTFESTIGEPGGDTTGRVCPGNTIGGSLHMKNSSGFTVESNTIGGSVHLSASKLELNGNTIGGSLLCSDGTVILPSDVNDPPGNTVQGKSTC